jgi:hypothetical protein
VLRLSFRGAAQRRARNPYPPAVTMVPGPRASGLDARSSGRYAPAMLSALAASMMRALGNHVRKAWWPIRRICLMRTQIARTLGVKHLYHYQPLNLDWLRQTVVENIVHCPSPQDFNDPWDCKPCFDDSIADDPSERDRLVTYLTRRFGGNFRARLKMSIANGRIKREAIRVC